MTWWAWMVLGAVLLGAELFAVDAQFYLVFLGVSAGVVGLASLFGLQLPEWGQWLTFAVVALIFFVAFRKALYEKIHGGGQGYVDRIVGESVKVGAEILPNARGRAEYRGSDWNVQNVGDKPLPAGSPARVVEVDGLTLKIEAE